MVRVSPAGCALAGHPPAPWRLLRRCDGQSLAIINRGQVETEGFAFAGVCVLEADDIFLLQRWHIPLSGMEACITRGR